MCLKSSEDGKRREKSQERIYKEQNSPIGWVVVVVAVITDNDAYIITSEARARDQTTISKNKHRPLLHLCNRRRSIPSDEQIRAARYVSALYVNRIYRRFRARYGASLLLLLLLVFHLLLSPPSSTELSRARDYERRMRNRGGTTIASRRRIREDWKDRTSRRIDSECK